MSPDGDEHAGAMSPDGDEHAGAMSPDGAPAFDAAHRRYLVIEQGVGAALFNLVLNGAIALLSARSLEKVPLWGGDTSIAVDTIATTFLLPFITCLIVTRLARRSVETGRLPPVAWRRTEHPMLGRLPARPVTRGLVLGVTGLVAFAPVVIWLLAALGVGEIGPWSFVAFKALFAALLSVVFTPLIALLALGDASPHA